MIIFSPIEYCNAKSFVIPFLILFLLDGGLFTPYFYLVLFFFVFPYFMCWGGLSYMFDCVCISYGFVSLRL
jgi:hypothetical protein